MSWARLGHRPFEELAALRGRFVKSATIDIHANTNGIEKAEPTMLGVESAPPTVSPRGLERAKGSASSEALRAHSNASKRHSEAPEAGLLRFLKAHPSEYRDAVRSVPIVPIRPEHIAMPDTGAIVHRQRKRRRRRWFHNNGGSGRDGGPK